MGMVVCTSTCNSYILPEDLFGSYVARLGTKFKRISKTVKEVS